MFSRFLLILSFCTYLSFSHSREYNDGDEMIPIFSESTSQESLSSVQSEEEEYSFSEEEVILPFYDYLDQFSCDLWKEIMERLKITQITRLSATCKSARFAFMTFDQWRFLEKFVEIRGESEGMINSYPKFFSEDSRSVFVWPEEIEQIVQQIAKIIRSEDELVSSVRNYLKTLEKEDDSCGQVQRNRVVDKKILQKLENEMNHTYHYGVYNLYWVFKAASSYPPLIANEEAENDLIYLFQRMGHPVRDVEMSSKKDHLYNRIFRNRWAIAGLSASAAVVCTGILYAYFHKFPAPLEPLHTWGNVTLGDLWEAKDKFPYVSSACIDSRHKSYYWRHDPPRTYDNPSREQHWHNGTLVSELVGSQWHGDINELLRYLRMKYADLNTTLWKEFILETKVLRPYNRENLKGICTVDLDGKSLTCAVCEKSGNNMDFTLELTHVDGVCAQNRWLFSLMNFAFLSIETISLPVIGMICNFLGLPTEPLTSFLVCFFLFIQFAVQWTLSLVFAFAA